MFRTLGKQFKDRWGKKSKTKRRANRLAATRQRSATRQRLWLEPLEDRTLLTINFGNMASILSGDLNHLTSTLSSQFSSADAIPLVGNQLSKVDALSRPFTDLTNKLGQLGLSSNPNLTIQGLVGGNVTAASVMPSGPNDTQVDVMISFSASPG